MTIRKRRWKTRNGVMREAMIEDRTVNGKRVQHVIAPLAAYNAAAAAAMDWFTLPSQYRTKERLIQMLSETT